MFLEQNSNKTCGEVFGYTDDFNDKVYNNIMFSKLLLTHATNYIELRGKSYNLVYYCTYSLSTCKFVGFADKKSKDILDYIKFEDLI